VQRVYLLRSARLVEEVIGARCVRPAPAGAVDHIVEQAFRMWESVTPVVFPRQAQPHLARLSVRFAPIDGARKTIGQTAGGAMVLDSGEQWSITLPPSLMARPTS
jgi:hypothetical protein